MAAAQRKKKRKKKPKPRGRTGRSRTGLRPGEKLKDYPAVTVRLPPEVRAQLEALSASQGRPQWRVLVDAIQAYATSHAALAGTTTANGATGKG